MFTMKSLITFARYSKFGINRLCYSCGFVKNSVSNPVHSRRKFLPICDVKTFCSFRKDDTSGEHSKAEKQIASSVTDSGKYKPFKDENASLILDVNEERQRIEETEVNEEQLDEFAGLNLERGVTGVFDIEDLVDVLRRENAEDIFVASLPPHLQYVDYIVVVSGKSLKHMLGMAEFIRRLYKFKRNKSDIIPRLEGQTSKDWLAIDLGNIALHILTTSARPIYDIEMLWAVGKDYDENCNAPEVSLAEILKKHEISLDDLVPVDSLR